MLLSGIPIPPSINNAYVNVVGKGRRKTKRYRTWANAAGWAIRAQKPVATHGPVHLVYSFTDGSTKADLGNLEKCLTDLLVDLKLIDGDGPKVVRSILLEWQVTSIDDGVTVWVHPA